MSCPYHHGTKIEASGLHAARVSGPEVANPAEAAQTAAEGAFDSRRNPAGRVLESLIAQRAAHGFMHGQQALPAFAGRSGSRLGEQRHLAGHAAERGHERPAGIVLQYEPGEKLLVRKIRERIVEALRRVHFAQGRFVFRPVLADAHK